MSLTSACPGPGVGTATSSTARSLPNSLTTAAFMVGIVLSWLLVIVTLAGMSSCTPGCGRAGSEEAELLGGVRHQQVLGLLVVVEHHLVVLATDARALVAAERGRGRVRVVAVRPHPTRLDVPPRPVGDVALARPDPGAQPVE